MRFLKTHLKRRLTLNPHCQDFLGRIFQINCPRLVSIKPSIRCAFLVKFVLVLFLMQPLLAQTIDRIIAVVNEEIITQADVDKVLAAIEAEYKSVYPDPQQLEQRLKEVKENIIKQMIEEKLILSEAKKLGLSVADEIVQGRIEQLKENFSSVQEFEAALAVEGLTLKELRDRFNEQEIMKKAVEYFVRSKVKIGLAEIKQYYQVHQKEIVRPERVKAKSIFIRADEPSDQFEALEKMKIIFERLKRGEDFAALAKECSQGAMAEEGGDLGFIEKGQLMQEIDEAIFALNPGEFTHVLKAPHGYRIFKVIEKEPAEPLSFSEVQDLIKDMLYKQEFAETFKRWIDELKQSSYIVIK